jgi:hypothetical protein
MEGSVTKPKGFKGKGKSPIDKKHANDSARSFNGSMKNSIEGKILRGEWLLPGLDRKQTISAYRAWQKDFRIDQQSLEKWYREKVRDNDRHADVK